MLTLTSDKIEAKFNKLIVSQLPCQQPKFQSKRNLVISADCILQIDQLVFNCKFMVFMKYEPLQPQNFPRKQNTNIKIQHCNNP